MDISAASAIRTVPWKHLPLGCVIIAWPQIAGASIPELLDYPVVTERLRDHLSRTYQFLQSRTVTIVDPSSGIELPDVRSVMAEAAQLSAAVTQADALKRNLRQGLLTRPDVREGLSGLMAYSDSPFVITRSWSRSVAEILRDQNPFGIRAWPELTTETRVSDLAVSMITGGTPPLSVTQMSVDIGFDVSRSMMIDERADYAYAQALALLETLGASFPLLRWRLWMVSDSATIAADSESPRERPPLATVMRRSGVRAGETVFAPFLTKVSTQKPDTGAHLVVLITDGACSDRSATLRSAERLGRRGSDYLQIILHRDDDHRTVVQTQSQAHFVDNIRSETDITETDTVVERTDEQIRAAVDRELGEITDIAEAAQGAQLIMTYFPIFSMVTLEVYEQYLGTLVVGQG